MKKLTALCLVLMLVLSCAACSSGPKVEVPTYELDSSLGLSDSVLDGQLAIEGVVYQMPIQVSQLEADGWSYDFGSEVLEPGNFGMVHFSKDGMSFSTKVANEYGEAKPVAECHVAAMTFGPQTADYEFYYTTKGNKLANVQFSSGVNMSSTEKQLRAALGEPSTTASLSWWGDNGKYLNPGHSFSVHYNEDGTLHSITVEYLPKDFQP